MSSWKRIKKILIQISFHLFDASAELRTVGVGPRNWPAPNDPKINQFLSILSQHAPLHFVEMKLDCGVFYGSSSPLKPPEITSPLKSEPQALIFQHISQKR
jgi:hypothetical protein